MSLACITYRIMAFDSRTLSVRAWTDACIHLLSCRLSLCKIRVFSIHLWIVARASILIPCQIPQAAKDVTKIRKRRSKRLHDSELFSLFFFSLSLSLRETTFSIIPEIEFSPETRYSRYPFLLVRTTMVVDILLVVQQWAIVYQCEHEWKHVQEAWCSKWLEEWMTTGG